MLEATDDYLTELAAEVGEPTARQQSRADAIVRRIRALRDDGVWPPIAPTVVLVKSLQGHSGRDATTNRFLRTCVIETLVA